MNTNWLTMIYRSDKLFTSNWEKPSVHKPFLVFFIFLLFCPEICQEFFWESIQVLFCLSQCHCHLIHGDRYPGKHEHIERCVVKWQWKHFQFKVHQGIPKVTRNNSRLGFKCGSETGSSILILLIKSDWIS